MSVSFQCEVSVEGGNQPLEQLVTESGINASELEKAAVKGAVWICKGHRSDQPGITSRPVRLRTLAGIVGDNSTVMLNYDERVLAQLPQPLTLVEDHLNYGIWNKPNGMLCQGSKWGDHTTATQVASSMLDRKCYPVHRLDKAASGLLIIAYTRNATRKLTRMFEQRQVGKMYEVVVSGSFHLPVPHTIKEPLDGKTAHTEIVQATYSEASQTSVLRVSIETGRKHQIRRHMAHCGFPVLGDRLYSNLGEHEHEQDLQLQATAIRFICPFTHQPVHTTLP